MGLRDSLKDARRVILFGVGETGSRPGIGVVLFRQLPVGLLNLLVGGRVWKVQLRVGILLHPLVVVVRHAMLSCLFGSPW